MTDLSFSYANARIKAMKSKLFDPDRMRELMDVRTLPEFIELLEESDYKPAFVAASTRFSGLELVKRALDDDLIATIERIGHFLPEHAMPTYRVLVREWELNNIKKIVASKALGRPIEMKDLIPIDRESVGLLARLLAAPDSAVVIEILRASRYSKAVRTADKDFEKTKDFRILLSELDRAYYVELHDALKLAPDAFTRGFLQDRLDFANAFLILRMLKSGVAKDKLRGYTVNSAHLANEMLAEDSIEGSLEAFARKKLLAPAPLVGLLKDKGLPFVEVELERALLRKARSTLARGVLSMGVAVAFLHLKREEVHSLRKIAYATQFEVKDEIRQRVLSAG